MKSRCRRWAVRLLWALARRLRVDRLPSFRAAFEQASGLPYDPRLVTAALKGAPATPDKGEAAAVSIPRGPLRPVLVYRYTCPRCGQAEDETLVGAVRKNPDTGWWDWLPGVQGGAPPPDGVPPGCPACGVRMEPGPVRAEWAREAEDEV